MLLAFDATRAASSFASGLLAAVNPCGFVLLPAYLMYFLGMEQSRPGAQRGSLRRALAVGTAVSAGFMVVFIVIGALVKWQAPWIQRQAPWAALIIAALILVLGVAMIFGYQLPVTTPKLNLARKDRTVRAMFVFGIAYAISSIGCTLPTFTGTVLGGLNSQGFFSGVGYILLYAVGMGLLVIGLTVTLAAANTWLLGALRRGMRHVNTIAGVVLVLTGMYLLLYWYNDLRGSSSAVTDKGLDWQERLRQFVDGHRTAIAVVMGLVVAAAIVAAVAQTRRRRVTETGAP